MNRYVIDTSGWIEYLKGTDLGWKVKEIVEDEKNTIITPALAITELASFFIRKGMDLEKARKIILSLSILLDMDFRFAQKAGRIHGKMKKDRKKISMTDVCILLAAKESKAKLVTKDQDFKGLKNVIMLK